MPIDHVRFIVTGDDRWNTKSPRAGMDENGVNVTGFGRVVKSALAEKPDAMIVTGDLVGGAETDEEESSQLDTWFKVMKPVYDAGVTVLPVMGNHEMHCPHPEQVWAKAMTGEHVIPGSGQVGDYTYTLRNSLFIGLDVADAPAKVSDQAWLDKVLSGHHAPNVFAFAHKPAFFSGNHADGMWTLPDDRDRFMTSLKDAGARVVFFGHDHLYDHSSAKLPGWSNEEAIHQFVIGTAGAPFVDGKALTTQDRSWVLTRIAHVERQLGYAVVDVDGPQVRLVYKSEVAPGDFEPVDTFSYTTKR